MSLTIYYGFLLTEKDVIKLCPGLLDEGQSFKDYIDNRDDDSSYLDLKITNKLIVETITAIDKEEERKIIVGVKLSHINGRYSSVLVVPEISAEATNIMKQFVDNNNIFISVKPVVFAYMHI